ncbi:hypothetical protein GWI33_006264 [Rhynchophorus ferrugineus]|uniref:Uncharacterized protein n=1 Tax=Rhynchophorus ferrugineus TaxID=354439 RepID=A0A834IHX5_RHYFE|nr:hypothetical protein GWI33_006264 [Rhynchophorus ferrugineus]
MADALADSIPRPTINDMHGDSHLIDQSIGTPNENRKKRSRREKERRQAGEGELLRYLSGRMCREPWQEKEGGEGDEMVEHASPRNLPLFTIKKTPGGGKPLFPDPRVNPTPHPLTIPASEFNCACD